MIANKRFTILSSLVLVTLIFSMIFPTIAFADNEVPPTDPAAEAVVGETDPAAEAVVGETDPAAEAVVGETDPAAEAVVGETDPAAEVAVGETDPAPEAPMAEESTAVVDSAPAGISSDTLDEAALDEIVATAAEMDVTLVDSSGEPLDLASTDTAQTLAAGDPYFTSGGTLYSFYPIGGCGAVPNCTESITPIQAALDFAAINLPDELVAPDGVLRRAIFVLPGTYNEPITISTANLTLYGNPGNLFVAGADWNAPILNGDGVTGNCTIGAGEDCTGAGEIARDTGVKITAKGVTLIGFVIQNYDTAIYENVVSGNDSITIENNTIQNNVNGLEISGGTGTPGTEVHYNIFQNNSGIDLINSQNDNNVQFVNAQNNYWGCADGPVVRHDRPATRRDPGGVDYFLWSTSDAPNDLDSINYPTEYGDCGVLSGYEPLFNNNGQGGQYDPFKIVLGELATTTEPPECPNGDFNGATAGCGTPPPTCNPDYNGDAAGCGEPPVVCEPDYNGEAEGCGEPPVVCEPDYNGDAEGCGEPPVVCEPDYNGDAEGCGTPPVVCSPEDYNGDAEGCGEPPVVCSPEDYNGDAEGCGTPPVVCSPDYNGDAAGCGEPPVICSPEDYNGDAEGCGTPPVVCSPDYNGTAEGCGTPPVTITTFFEDIFRTVAVFFGGFIPVTGGETHAITAGIAHTCALTPEGGVQCWGSNTYGQLGDGTNEGSSVRVDVSGLQGGMSIVAGGNHTCLLAGNDVWCWGQNAYGQIGDGSQIDRNIPVKVLSGAVGISAGLEYTCADMLDGTVMCWGNNEEKQFAAGASAIQTLPTEAKLFAGLSNIDAGQNKSCGLTEAGLVKCFVNGSSQKLGELIPVTGGAPATSLDVAANRFGPEVIALTEGGVPVVLEPGQPKLISDLNDVVDVDSGVDHACALKSDGSVMCWGSNGYGQLGTNSLASSLTPESVTDLSGAWQLAVGKNHVCVLVDADSIECWGLNTDGQLGNGTNQNSLVPVEVK